MSEMTYIGSKNEMSPYDLFQLMKKNKKSHPIGLKPKYMYMDASGTKRPIVKNICCSVLTTNLFSYYGLIRYGKVSFTYIQVTRSCPGCY